MSICLKCKNLKPFIDVPDFNVVGRCRSDKSEITITKMTEKGEVTEKVLAILAPSNITYCNAFQPIEVLEKI